MIDRDGDGFVTRAELRDLLSENDFPNAELDRMIDEVGIHRIPHAGFGRKYSLVFVAHVYTVLSTSKRRKDSPATASIHTPLRSANPPNSAFFLTHHHHRN